MKKIITFIFAVLLMGTANVYAQVHLDPNYLGEDGAQNLVKYQNDTAEGALNEFLLHTADIVLYFAASIAVLALVIGAGHLVYGRGNEEATAKAKITIMWSIIGLFIVIFSYSLVRTVIYLIFSTID